jgi:hypothetical protein
VIHDKFFFPDDSIPVFIKLLLAITLLLLTVEFLSLDYWSNLQDIVVERVAEA